MWLRKDRIEKVEEEVFWCGFCKGKEKGEEKIEELRKIVQKKNVEIEELRMEIEKNREQWRETEKNILNVKMNEKQERKELEGKWVQVVKRGEEMRKNIEVVKENIEERKKNFGKEIRRTIEGVDKERNIIVRGLSEGKEEIEEMEKMLSELAKWKGEGVKGEVKVKVVDYKRLGEQVEGRIRPLKVELGSVFQVGRVVRNKAELRHRKDDWKNILIDGDLNWEERSRRAGLREKIKKMRLEGVRCFLEKGEIKIVKQRVEKNTGSGE